MGKEIPVFNGGMALVCGHACACHRDSAGRYPSHGGPLYLCPSDRIVHHHRMGHPGTPEKMAMAERGACCFVGIDPFMSDHCYVRTGRVLAEQLDLI